MSLGKKIGRFTEGERDTKEDVGEAVAWQRLGAGGGGQMQWRSKPCHSHKSAAGLDLEAGAKCQRLFSPGMSH